MSDFRILHLSDVHFGCSDIQKAQRRITDALIDAVHGHVGASGRAPDLVIFSGDLANRGATGEFEEGGQWLRRAVGRYKSPIFIVPGNHDAVRPRPGTKQYFKSRALRRKAGGRGGESYVAAQPALRKAGHLQNFCDWHAAFKRRGHVCSDWSESRLACCATLKKTFGPDGTQVRVLGLNTALVSMDDKDEGRLVADVGELNLFLSRRGQARTMDIVVSHHPIGAAGNGSAWLQRWNNDKLRKFLCQSKGGAHLYLHGHVHVSEGGCYWNIDGSRLFSYGAGAAYQGADWPMHFMFMDFSFGSNAIETTVFSYSLDSGAWEKHTGQSRQIPYTLSDSVKTAAPDGGVSPPSPIVPAANARDVLQGISDRAAERFIPRAAMKNSAWHKSLNRLFDSLLKSASTPRARVDSILAGLIEGKLPLLSVKGDMGAGKAEFMALLYWTLRSWRDAGKPVPQPVFVDPTTWSNDAGGESAALVGEARNFGKGCIVFKCGFELAAAEMESDASKLVTAMSVAGAVRVMASHDRSKDEAADDSQIAATQDPEVRIRTPSCDDKVVRLFIDAIAPKIDSVATAAWSDATTKLVKKICADHGIPVSFFLVQECATAVSIQPKIASFADVLSARLQSLSHGAAKWNAESLAPRVFDAFKKRPHHAKNRGVLMLPPEPDCPSEVRRLLRSHPSVEHWLVAQHAFAAFIRIGGLVAEIDSSGKATNASDKLAMLFEGLKYVYPVHINAFVKELFDKAIDVHRTEIFAALNEILGERSPQAGLVLKSHACYLAGRLKSAEGQPEFVAPLRAAAKKAEKELAEIQALRESLKTAQAFGARAMQGHIKTVASEIFPAHLQIRVNGGSSRADAMAASKEFDDELDKVERELLLLQRSALISLAYLEQPGAADLYIKGLISDIGKDDMNRGFHLEYYGDVVYTPKAPLLSTDSFRYSCANSFQFLTKCLAKKSTSHELASIQAVTLASLARHRHAKSALDDRWRSQIIRCLKAAKKRKPLMSSVVREFLDVAIAELQVDGFVVERYVDGLYELKFQRRVGWGGLRPFESVAAHSYFAELLGRLFVPMVDDSKEKIDRVHVMRLIAHHDLAEAIVGDTRNDRRTSATIEREKNVIKRVAQLGALTQSKQINDLVACYEGFARRSNSAEMIARDMDRLDMLIQLMRYRRENRVVPRYKQLRSAVLPDRFRVKAIAELADGFLKYFDNEIRIKATKFQSTRPLWPAGKIESKRPTAAPARRG